MSFRSGQQPTTVHQGEISSGIGVLLQVGQEVAGQGVVAVVIRVVAAVYRAVSGLVADAVGGDGGEEFCGASQLVGLDGVVQLCNALFGGLEPDGDLVVAGQDLERVVGVGHLSLVLV